MKAKVLAAFMVFSIPVASNALEIGGSENLPNGLKAALTRYYEAENDHRWEITYAMRPKLFRSTVPFQLYVKEMSEGMGEWNLVRLRTSTIRQEGAHVFLGVIFTDLPASRSLPLNVDSAGAPEETEWVQEDGQWTCVSCGRRFRLPLNGALAR